MIFRFAYMRANTGYAGSSSVIRVALSSIKYSEYSTGVVKDITNIYSTAQCSTTAYQTVTSYLKSKNTCLFSKIISPISQRNNTVICQGFVKSVDYTVTHLTTLYGIITSVSADVIITDVPINIGTSKVLTGNLAGSSSQSPAVSVMQSFSVSFTSGDTSKADNVNGNVVKRYLPPALVIVFVLPLFYSFVPVSDPIYYQYFLIKLI